MLSQVLRWAHEGYQGIVKINIGCEPKFGLRKCAVISTGVKLKESFGHLMAEPMQRIEAPSEPWQGEAIDVLGPLPSGENILVVVDYYAVSLTQ